MRAFCTGKRAYGYYITRKKAHIPVRPIIFYGVHMENIKRITLKAPAKINLYLGVVCRRADGYHDIESVMQTIDLCDRVTVSLCEESADADISVVCKALPNLPAQKNIAYRAARAFLAYNGIENYNIAIEIDKKIPSEAGLGGGSSDAAATLRALDKLYGTKLSSQVLYELGKSIGADVPFLLRRGTAFVEGIGEIMSDCTPAPFATVLVAFPNREKISTKEAYANVDGASAFSSHADFEKMKEAMRSCDIDNIASAAKNIFEDVIPKNSVIFKIKETMNKNGAALSLMSGSGSAVFGIFKDARDAKRAREALSDVSETFISGMFTRDESYIEN